MWACSQDMYNLEWLLCFLGFIIFVNITSFSIHYYLQFAYILGGLEAGNKRSGPNMVGIYAIPGAEHAQHPYIPSASS